MIFNLPALGDTTVASYYGIAGTTQAEHAIVLRDLAAAAAAAPRFLFAGDFNVPPALVVELLTALGGGGSSVQHKRHRTPLMSLATTAPPLISWWRI